MLPEFAEILLGLEDINLIGVEDQVDKGVKLPLRVHIECRGGRPKCPVCSGESYSKGTYLVELTDLPGFGRCRMAILADGSAESLHPFVTANVEPGATVVTDGWSGYQG
ncbi:MAG: transposase, partial [Ferrimicrobium sp.]